MKVSSNAAIEKVFNEALILDSLLLKIELNLNSENQAIFYLKKENVIYQLNFLKIHSIMINELEDDGFLITHFKLFIENGIYYFSFDPHSENKTIDEMDNNYISSYDFFIEW